jgi:hypothetical protein
MVVVLGGADGVARDERMKNGDLEGCRLCVWVVVVMVLLMCAPQRFFSFFSFFLCGRGNFTGGGGCCLYLKFTNLHLETGIA